MAHLAASLFKDCLLELLRPIVRFCIRNSVKHQEFVGVSKRLFVEEASAELLRRNIQKSTSRISVMTGLQRRDVDRLARGSGYSPRTPNLIARVVGRWASDARYLNKSGKPRALATEGKHSEFARLVESVSRDLNHHTVLFELERVGLVKRDEEEAHLMSPSYTRRDDLREGFRMLGDNLDDLTVAVEENVADPSAVPNLHAATEYDNIDPEDADEIRRWFLQIGRTVHAQARRFLSKYDRDIGASRAPKGSERLRVVLATFSRMETLRKPNKKK